MTREELYAETKGWPAPKDCLCYANVIESEGLVQVDSPEATEALTTMQVIVQQNIYDTEVALGHQFPYKMLKVWMQPDGQLIPERMQRVTGLWYAQVPKEE